MVLQVLTSDSANLYLKANTVVTLQKAIEEAVKLGGLETEISAAQKRLAQVQAEEAKLTIMADKVGKSLTSTQRPTELLVLLKATDIKVRERLKATITARIQEIINKNKDETDPKEVLALLKVIEFFMQTKSAPESWGLAFAGRIDTKKRLAVLLKPLLMESSGTSLANAVAMATDGEKECRLLGSIIAEGFGENIDGDYQMNAGSQVHGAPTYCRIGDPHLWLTKTDKDEWAFTDAANKGTITGVAFSGDSDSKPWKCQAWLLKGSDGTYTSRADSKIDPLIQEAMSAAKSRIHSDISQQLTSAIGWPDLNRIKQAITTAATHNFTEGVSEAKAIQDVLEKIANDGGLSMPSASNVMSEEELRAIKFEIPPTGACSCLSGPDQQPAFTTAQVRQIITKRSLARQPPRVSEAEPVQVRDEVAVEPIDVTSLPSTPFDSMGRGGQEWSGQRSTGRLFESVSKALGEVAGGVPLIGGVLKGFCTSCAMLGDKIAQLSDNADAIVDTVNRLAPFSTVMQAAIADIHQKYPDGNLPEGISRAMHELTRAVNETARVLAEFCQLSPSQQLMNINSFERDLKRKLDDVDSHRDTFHLALTSDTGSQVNKIDKGIEKLIDANTKKNARDKVLDQRESFLDKFRMNDSKLKEHPDPELNTLVFRGGFSTVRVKMYEDEHTVAVKEINLQGVAFTEQKKLFHQFGKELTAMCEVRHQNCITCYGWVETTQHFSFVMEYAERGELRQILDDTEKYPVIPLPTSLKVAWGAAKGLAHLHERGITHKDIKSLNIFVTKAFDARIGDFGLSQVQQGAGATTRGATTMSQAKTPAWACPEFGEAPYNSKCDVYSFGVVLWEIATRLFPFDGIMDTVINKKVCVREVRPDEAAPVPPDFTPEYNALVQVCWAQQPGDRPDMSEVVDRLKSVLDALLDIFFQETDLNGDGIISLSELTTKLSSFSNIFTESQIKTKFSDYDTTGTGKLQKPQALQLFRNLYSN